MRYLKTLISALVMVAVLCMASNAEAALSAARYTKSKNTGPAKRYLMTVSQTIYKGGFVMLVAAGTAQAAAASASNNGIVGVATETVTSAASGATYITVVEGWFLFGATTLGQDDVMELVYAEDDETIDETLGSNEPTAGLLIEYVSASSGWVHVSPIYQVRTAQSDPLTLAGDLTLGGGQGALTFTDSASSIVTPANDATSLLIGAAAVPGLITIDTQTGADEVNIVGTTATSTFRVDTGFATFDEQAVFTSGADVNDDALFGGGAGAITFDAASASIVTTDNSATGLDIGATGATTMLRLVTTDDGEYVQFNEGVMNPLLSVTGVVSLTHADCGKMIAVTDAADGDDITLPATVDGCAYVFVFVGADGGALVDISPNASDAIHGSVTLAAAVTEANGTDDNDWGLTKATANTGDTCTLVGDGTEGWYITTCTGIWANN